MQQKHVHILHLQCGLYPEYIVDANQAGTCGYEHAHGKRQPLYVTSGLLLELPSNYFVEWC